MCRYVGLIASAPRSVSRPIFPSRELPSSGKAFCKNDKREIFRATAAAQNTTDLPHLPLRLCGVMKKSHTEPGR